MRISDEAARQLGELIHRACKDQGLRDKQVAARAMVNLPPDAPLDLEITPYYIHGLRGVPRQPLATENGRLKLAAVVEALGLDREMVNRLAGGI